MSRQSDYKSSSAAVPSPTPATHPSSDGNSTTSHQSETPSMDDNAATPPPLKQLLPPPPRSKTPSFPVRDDCWSEEATFTLIDAWGDRFIELNRGNLRQKHWQEVADAVNARHGHVKKARRTDVQCKNRIDTLKKKYKVEKPKVIKLGASNYVSPWPFFAPMDSLIGSVFKPSTRTPTPPNHRKRIPAPPSLPALPPPPSSVPVGRRSKRPAPPVLQPSTDSSFFRRNFSVMAAAAAAIDGAEADSDGSWSSDGNQNRNWSRKRKRNWNRFGNGETNGNESGDRRRRLDVEERSGDPYDELAEAIGRFAEVYARVEDAKQRQMVELEKQRMQFTKDLELQRMKLIMESQVQLEKMKRLNSSSERDFRMVDEEEYSD